MTDIPSSQSPGLNDSTELRVERLTCSYGHHTVVHDVTLEVPRGTCAALVGESGAGKSTIARVITGMQKPDSGRVFVAGRDIAQNRQISVSRHGEDLGPRWARRPAVQMIFQDPISSLNPARALADIVAEPYEINSDMPCDERRRRAHTLLEQVGIDADTYADARPGEISGGQAQRVAIARVIAGAPDLLICDEPVSSLDVSVQAMVLNLFADLRDKEGMSMLFISHDLSVVRMISDTVAVLDEGTIVEHGDTEDVIHHPRHPYTQRLIASVPSWTHSRHNPNNYA